MAKSTRKEAPIQVSLRGGLPARTELAAAGMDESSIRAAEAVRIIAACCGDLEQKLTIEEIAKQTGLKAWEIRAVLQGPEFTRLFEEALSQQSAMLMGKALARMDAIIQFGEDKDAVAAFRAVNACYRDVTSVAAMQDSEAANIQMTGITERLRRARVSRIETVDESDQGQRTGGVATQGH